MKKVPENFFKAFVGTVHVYHVSSRISLRGFGAMDSTRVLATLGVVVHRSKSTRRGAFVVWLCNDGKRGYSNSRRISVSAPFSSSRKLEIGARTLFSIR
jgi:hypothetical protein